MLAIATYLVPTRVAVNSPQVTPGGEVLGADDVPNAEVMDLRVVKLELEKTRAQHPTAYLHPRGIPV